MDEEKFLLLSLDDSRTKKLSEVLSSKTAKKIIDYLAENLEASEKDLSDGLEVPINTIEYNLKKLVESGLVQKRKNFFWSKKGKKIVMYELSNKSIIISPKKKISKKLLSTLPVVIFGTVLSFGAFVYDKIRFVSRNVINDNVVYSKAYEATATVANSSIAQGSTHAIQSPNNWVWFLFGSFIMIILFTVINWRRL